MKLLQPLLAIIILAMALDSAPVLAVDKEDLHLAFQCQGNKAGDEKHCANLLSRAFFKGKDSSQGLIAETISFACIGKSNLTRSRANVAWNGISIIILSQREVHVTKHAREENSKKFGLLREFNFRTTFDNEEPMEMTAIQAVRDISQEVDKNLKDIPLEKAANMKVTQLQVVNNDEIIPKMRAHRKLLLEIDFDNNLGAVVAEFDLTGVAKAIDATLAQCRQPSSR